MGNDQSIPYTQLYDEWQDLNCDESFFQKDANGSDVDVVVIKLKKGVAPTDPKPMLEKLKTRVFVIVYLGDMFHVATVLQRDHRIEYLDSMASDQSGHVMLRAQRALEMLFRNAVQRYNKQRGGDDEMRFYDSFSMYGRQQENEQRFLREPPQNCEQQFLGCFDRFCSNDEASKENRKYCECDNKELQQYYQSLKKHHGGDCVFWSHYIARDLIETGKTSEEWSKQMHTTLTNGAPEATVTQMGSRAAKFITGKIFADLVRCKKESFKKKTLPLARRSTPAMTTTAELLEHHKETVASLVTANKQIGDEIAKINQNIAAWKRAICTAEQKLVPLEKTPDEVMKDVKAKELRAGGRRVHRRRLLNYLIARSNLSRRFV